jgi:ankyrin repeat protein
MKNFLTLLIFFAAINTFAQNLVNEQTSKLHEYLLSFDMDPSNKPDLSVVKELVRNGADVNAIGITGANAAHLATESWSYTAYDTDGSYDQASYQLIKIIEFLISEGSDYTIEDNRQLTGLYTAMRWGSKNPTFDRIFEILTINNNNLNNSDLDGFTMAHLLSRRRMISTKQLKKLLDNGLDLTKITKSGLSIAHQSANAVPKDGEILYLKELFNTITDKSIKSKLALGALDDGNTPLHFAIRAKNLAAVKFLVESYQADVNKLNNSMRSPYSISIDKKYFKISNYLESKGGYIVNQQDGVNCSNRNDIDITYEKILELISHCNIKKMKNLLKILPARYLGQHTTAYFTLAAQDASPSYPQIIVYGETGKTMMTFNGHHSQNGFSNLEFIVYRDETKKFEMRDIRFPKNRNGKVLFSKKNPARCTTCHGQDPIPLWDTWTTWPGKFLGESASRTPVEDKYYQKFMSNRNYGRYKYLPAVSHEPTRTFFEEIPLGKFANSKMDEIVTGLMSQKVSKDFQNPKLTKYRYAILGALSCSDSIDEFIPKKIREAYNLSLNYLKKDTKVRSANEMKNRIRLLEEIIPGGPQTRYVIQAKLFSDKPQGENRAGRNRDILRTARIRYIVENLGLSMKSWFTPFNRGLPSYMMPTWNGIEVEAWKFLLDVKTDSELYKTYEQKRSGFNFFQGFNPFFYKTEHESSVCEKLKANSIQALSK